MIITLQIANTVPNAKRGSKMSKNVKPANDLAIVSDAAQNPDSRIDIATYARIAHRERDAAIAAALRQTAGSIHALWLAIWRGLGRPGRIRSNAPLRG